MACYLVDVQALSAMAGPFLLAGAEGVFPSFFLSFVRTTGAF